MKTYFYRGSFDRTVVEHIVETGAGLERVMRVSVEAFGGKVIRCHLSASSVDPIGFLEFAEDIAARSWNAFYSTQPGVTGSTIERLLDEADIADLGKRVQASRAKAVAHR